MAATEATTVVRYLHTDALGSPAAESDEYGYVVKRTRYEPYGAPTDGNYVNGPGFTGHVTDAATGLTYMQQRYYDPMAGQFLSLDPVTVDGGSGGNFNRYWYANNNPYRFVDPDGRSPNQEGVTSVATVYDVLRRESLPYITDNFTGNVDRYFYTSRFGWVDVRHFAQAANLTQMGIPGGVVKALGFAKEMRQWAGEWGDMYRSGFSQKTFRVIAQV